MDDMIKILTPTQLWDNYDPYALPLNESIIHEKEINKFICKTIKFTVDTLSDGDIIGAADIYYPKKKSAPWPLILLADSYSDSFQKNIDFLLENNFAVAVFNYTGEHSENPHITQYPESISYCNLNKIGNHFYNATPTVKDTAIYHWVKIARRLINVLEKDKNIDKNNIGAIGYLEGANIMWQVASMDKRIKAFAPLVCIKYIFKETNSKDISPTNKERFLIGASPQSYAKFLNVPTFMLTTTNNDETPINEITDTISVFPKTTTKRLYISRGNSCNFEKDTKKNIVTWFNTYLEPSSKPNVLPKSPALSYTIKEDSILFEVKADTKTQIVDASLLLAVDDENSSFKNWIIEKLDIKANGKSEFSYLPFTNSKFIYAFVNIKYKNGLVLSSLATKINFKELTDVHIAATKNTRIIYNQEMGASPFLIETPYVLHNEGDLSLTKGPKNIYGISTKTGNLTTYSISSHNKQGGSSKYLQFNAFSPVEKEISLILTVLENGKYINYKAIVNLVDTENWEQFSFTLNDFKNDNMTTLVNWDNIKKLTFANAENVIFNNIIWI